MVWDLYSPLQSPPTVYNILREEEWMAYLDMDPCLPSSTLT